LRDPPRAGAGSRFVPPRVKEFDERRDKQMLSGAQIPTDCGEQGERPGTRLMNHTPDSLSLTEPRDPGGGTKGEKTIGQRIELCVSQQGQGGGFFLPKAIAIEGTRFLTAGIAIPRTECDPGSQRGRNLCRESHP